jgi:hypothetical protein
MVQCPVSKITPLRSRDIRIHVIEFTEFRVCNRLLGSY